MGNHLRIEFEDAIYHVISRGVLRKPTFIDDSDHLDFLDRLASLVQDGNIILYAWCLMPNHFHLLLKTPHGWLSRWMKALIGGYTQKFNRRHERVGHLWQGRYRSILVEDGSYLVDCSRYIHLNPCRSKNTGKLRLPQNYRWSSYRNFIEGPRMTGLVDTKQILSFFENPKDITPSAAYRKYVEEGLANPDTGFGDFLKTSAVAFGSPDFQYKVGEMIAPSIDPLLNGSSKARAMLSELTCLAEEICKHVDTVLSQRPYRKRRQIKLYLLQKLTFHSNRSIASHLNIHATTVGKAAMSLQREMEQDEELRDEVKTAIESICFRYQIANNNKL